MSSRKVQNLAAVVGSNISRRRKEKGLTQAEFAEQLNIGADSLSRIEKGVIAPRFPRLEGIARLLECAVADLFRKESDSLNVKVAGIVDMLECLPEDMQEDVIGLMEEIVRIFRKRL